MRPTIGMIEANTGKIRAGRMTQVMRAMSLDDAPRRLRIAIVEGGRVVDEQLIAEGAHLTVGASEKADVLTTSRGVHQLFEHLRGSYRMHVPKRAGGRIALSGKIRPLVGGQMIELPEDARGKIVLGDTTLLFQLVVAPPQQPAPQLPISVQRRFASEVDWFTTVVASFSFLLHFFAVAAVYSDWLDPVMDEEYAVGRLVETSKNLPPPPLEPRPTTPDVDVKIDQGAKKAPTAKAPGKAVPGSKASPGARGPGARGKAGKPGSSNPDALAAELMGELESINVHTLAALSTGGPATDNVLDGGEVPVGDLDRAGRENIAARTGDPGGLNIGGRGDPNLRPGQESGDLSSIGNDTATDDAADESRTQTREVEGPIGTVSSSGGAATPDNIPGVGSTVARMRGRFRACYQRGLNNINPNMQGSVVLVVKVGAAGEVLSVSGGGGGLAPIVPCLKAVVRGAQFQPPKNGAGIVSINIIFKTQ